jgi:mRNA interferase RelE/StbE
MNDLRMIETIIKRQQCKQNKLHKMKGEEYMKFVYYKSARKSIQSLNEPYKSRIKQGIEHLPFGDIKKLQGYENMYRLRIGDYRVLFFHEGETFYIIDVLPRGEAYKRI